MSEIEKPATPIYSFIISGKKILMPPDPPAPYIAPQDEALLPLKDHFNKLGVDLDINGVDFLQAQDASYVELDGIYTAPQLEFLLGALRVLQVQVETEC